MLASPLHIRRAPRARGATNPFPTPADDMNAMAHGFAALQAVAGVGDTLIMKTVPVQHSLIEQVTAVANAIITIALLALVIVGVPLAWSFRKSYRRVNELLDKIRGDIKPLVHHASVVAANLHHITESVKADIDTVSGTIRAGNERVREAMDATEQRLSDLNALLDVVQEEAEQIFVSTAAGVRGMRSGAARFGRRGLDLASAELDRARAGEPDDDFEMEQEIADGNDYESRGRPESAADAFSVPRIRPRVTARPRDPDVS
jgi:uncharacterized protein YoxC